MNRENDNFDIGFGENKKTDDVKPEDKPMTKEEKAKLIAKNMAGVSLTDSPDEINFYQSVPSRGQRSSVQIDHDKVYERGGGAAARNIDDDRDIDIDFLREGQSTYRDTQKKSKENSAKSKKKKKKKSSAGKKAAAAVGCLAAVIILCAGAFYLVGLNTYKGRFLDNTYINGINVSGLTQADAYTLVSQDSTIPETFIIRKRDGSEFTVKLEDIGYVDNTKVIITQYYSQQNHYAWLGSKFKKTQYNFSREFNYDKSKLEEIIKRKVINDSGSAKPQDAYITKSDDGINYVVIKEQDGDRIDPDKTDTLYKYAQDALDGQIFYIDVSQVDCYEKAEVTSEDLEDICDRLNYIYTMEINFDFIYTTETLSGDRIMEWVDFDEDNPEDGYTVDEDKAMEYVEELADKYDTFNKDRTFKTTNRGTITIPQGEGCYGWWIDQEKTRDLIVEFIEGGDSASIEPIYYVNPDSQYSYTCNEQWRTANGDFSDTYIEVDLSAQHLWYYENGKLEMESNIVSGYSANEERNTPAGVYKLWYKERGKTLRGSTGGVSYASYVEYWNYVSTIGIGLHDASWQNGDFNSSKYKSSTWGSHGCINMPADKAKYVFENVDLDTPVFMYW